MSRILLLLPTRTYRAPDFMRAAERLGVDVVVASEEASSLAEKNPGGLLALDFHRPDEAARVVVAFAQRYPLDAVIGVDDETTIVAAQIAAALGLPHNSVESVRATRYKDLMRRLLARAGVPGPRFWVFSLDDNPSRLAERVEYPCVLKPTFLAASRGVIRANGRSEFLAAFRRIAAILRDPEIMARDAQAARQILVESYIPGHEVAVEGILVGGKLHPLALFDKPDPLEGPYFEETIYVTPSRHTPDVRSAIIACTARAAQAIGLREGPVHAELRINEGGPQVIEIAARSIGGLCSRTLRFGTGLSLEDIIIRHALGLDVASLRREHRAAGVMMIPIPRAGILREVRGIKEARAVPDIEDITITAHLGQRLVPLPEGSRYLGFIFSRADTPERAETALRRAHSRLTFRISDG